MAYTRTRALPKEKIALIQNLADMVKKNRTVLIASCRGLPSSQFHAIKKSLRGIAHVTMVKKKAATRAFDASGKKGIVPLKDQLQADIALFFSHEDAFKLSAILSENQIPSKARAGDVAPEDLEIQPGPTDLVPGPAISELSGVGLKVAVKEGKLEVIKGAVVAKKGEKIKDTVAAVLGKLNIAPMKVGFLPIAAFDGVDDKVYVGITIDKEGTLTHLRESITKALGFAVGREYYTSDTVKYFLAKASTHEKAIQKMIKEGT